MKLPRLKDLNVSHKRVLLRADLDISVGKNGSTTGEFRLVNALSTFKYLIENKAKLIVIGHRGRPKGEKSSSLSLREVAEKLSEMLKKKVDFVSEVVGERTMEAVEKLAEGEVLMLENLRFNKGEEENNLKFAKALADLGDVYVNEAFASSHRKHASIVGLPSLLPHAAGYRFEAEVNNLGRIFKNPKRPLVVIVGGAKKDKTSYLDDFKKLADRVLVGGRLPDYLGENYGGEKVLVAKLVPDKGDITTHSIERFEEVISQAKTIFLAGPMGKFEEEGHLQGTQRIFEAVATADAFKIAGGRETQKVITMFNLEDKFDWISVGGGAALEFLAKRTLPGIKALGR